MKMKKGKCPVCNSNLASPKEELLKKLDLEDGLLNEEVVKKAFKEKSKSIHPDKGGSPELFQELVDTKNELLEMVKEENPFNISPIESALNRSTDELLAAQPIQRPHLSNEQIHSMFKAIKNLRNAHSQNPSAPCPYCKKSNR
jgi:hypothetical protein